jgi:uncharacterized small protein (DUF1192 family)
VTPCQTSIATTKSAAARMPMRKKAFICSEVYHMHGANADGGLLFFSGCLRRRLGILPDWIDRLQPYTPRRQAGCSAAETGWKPIFRSREFGARIATQLTVKK